MLPELEKSLENTGSMVVQFNTCAFQRRVAERWYKPAQWAGRLEGLERKISTGSATVRPGQVTRP